MNYLIILYSFWVFLSLSFEHEITIADLKMVKRTVYVYRTIQFVKRHDLDQLMQTVVIQLNGENLAVIALVQHQIQPTHKNATVHAHRWRCIKLLTKIAPVQPIRAN